MAVEELARRTGTTVSNLRALQAKGLLDPPELVGRKGFYSDRHQARVALLRRLQDRGYSLAAIEDLLRGWKRGAGLMEVLGLEDAVSGSRAVPQPVDLESTLPALARDPASLERAIAAELLVRDGAQLVAPDAALLEGFRDYLDAGYPVSALLDELEWLTAATERIAQRFRGAFEQHVVAPFLAAGAPAHELGDLSGKVERLRAHGVHATSTLLTRALERGGSVPGASGKHAREVRRRTGKKRSR